MSTVVAAAGDIRNAVPTLFPEPLPEPVPPTPPPGPVPPPPLPPAPLPLPAPWAGGLVVGEGLGPVLVVPDAGGVDGVGEADGEGEGAVDAVGVGVGFAVGVVVADRVGELVLRRPGSEVVAVAGAREMVGVPLPEWWPPVEAGDCVIPGVWELSERSARSAAITVPAITSRTSATRASRGSEAVRRRPGTRPVPGSPGSGNAAVACRWKRSGAPGGVAPASSAPLAAAVPGDGTAPLGGSGAPG